MLYSNRCPSFRGTMATYPQSTSFCASRSESSQSHSPSSHCQQLGSGSVYNRFRLALSSLTISPPISSIGSLLFPGSAGSGVPPPERQLLKGFVVGFDYLFLL